MTTLLETRKCGMIKVLHQEGQWFTVRFVNTGSVKVVHRVALLSRSIKDPEHPSVCGVARIGFGRHKSRVNGKLTKAYSIWVGMIERCYKEPRPKKYASYEDCTVHPSWLRFQDFADWFELHYREGHELDKDLLNQGNKVYSPENCVFIPSMVNSFLASSSATRGKYPIGVSFSKQKSKYEAYCNDPFNNSRKINLGLFETESDAHDAWVTKKKELARKIVNAGHLRDKALIQALLNYPWEKVK